MRRSFASSSVPAGSRPGRPPAAAILFVSGPLLSACSTTPPEPGTGRPGYPGPPGVRTLYDYYPVRGASYARVKLSLDESGFRSDRGALYYGTTSYRVRWALNLQSNEFRCRVATWEIATDVTIRMPQWVDSTEASTELWDRVIDALHDHDELGHHRHGIEAAQALDQMIGDMPPQHSCRELRQAIESASRGIVQAQYSKDLEYDRLTRNGQTQGAVF